MAVTTKTNGTVQSVSRSGSAKSATIRFPNDPPPPDFVDVIFECSAEDYADFRASLLADPPGKVDVSADYGISPASATAITTHR